MLRADRICIWIFILGLLFLIPDYMFLRYVDELSAVALGAMAILDSVLNGNWRRYRLLWVIIGIMTFYAIYSVLFLSFNTVKYIIVDWIIELKPYIPWVVFFAIRPTLKESDRQIIKYISLFNIVVSFLIALGGYSAVVATIGHISIAGQVVFVSTLAYAYCSIDEFGGISKSNLIAILLFFTMGLVCTRSKYYVEYICAIFFFVFYRPGVLRKLNLKHLMAFIALGLLIVFVSWNKFSYYYLTGNSDTFDPTTVQTFARPVLFATGGLILIDFFPFGSGLASFATYASAANYSDLYYYYGIDKVYGLSPQMGEFICDAFLPSLAQFGIVGLSLFIWFWVYVYRFLRPLARSAMAEYRYFIAVGSLAILFILIESTSGNAITKMSGFLAMSLLGVICGHAENVSDSENLTSPNRREIIEEELQLEKI